MTLGSNQPLTEMSTRNLEPSGHLGPVMGLIYLFILSEWGHSLGHKTCELSDKQKCHDFLITCPLLSTVQVTYEAYIFPPSIGIHMIYK